MDVDGFGSAVATPDGASGDPAGFSPEAARFIVRKRVDKASPYLTQAALKQSRFDELEVEQVRNGRLTACFRLRGVRVESLRLRSEALLPHLVEELGFGFDVIEWHYFPDSGPAGTAHIGSTWDFALGEGGVLGHHDDEAPSIMPVAPVELQPGGTVLVKVGLIAPAGDPGALIFQAFPSANGLVRVRSIGGEGDTRTLELGAGHLLNGSDQLLLSVSDGRRSSTRLLPVLVAGPRTAYEAYIEGFLAQRLKDDPLAGGLLRDPDGDRMSNIVEFYLGTDPGTFTRSGEALAFRHLQTPSGAQIRIRYFQRVDTPGLTATFEGSPDLGSWSALGPKTEPPLETEVLPGGNGTYAPVEARVPLGDRQRYFMRLSLEGSL